MIELAKGDIKASNDTSEEFYKSTDGLLKKTPILGHARGCLAYAMGDRTTGDETMVDATKVTVGMVILTLLTHGGFLINSCCCVVLQRVREVDFPETLRKSPEGAAPVKRVSTKYGALHTLQMLDETIDDHVLPFSPSLIFSPIDLFSRPRDAVASIPSLTDSDADSEVEVKQGTEIAEADQMQENQMSLGAERKVRDRARSCSRERRRSLSDWRQSMLCPRL
jgi:hypothetical protein